MFSWVDEFHNAISGISVKKPIKNTQKDAIALGIFTFKNINIFKESYKQLVENQSTVNGEFYIDGCINEAIRLGYKCQLMEVDTFLSWGTPDELNAYLGLQLENAAFK
jgi:hypothetical protein